MDTAFEKTILACARPRKNKEEGTWLVEEMVEAYVELHALGWAHSVEAWMDQQLVGGLYGVCIGHSFFGESMFSLEKDASKVALVALAHHLKQNNFDMIDCQVTTGHLLRMGASEMSRTDFLEQLEKSIQHPTDNTIWNQPEGLAV